MAVRFVTALSGLALLAVPAFSLALRDLWPALGPPLADQRLATIRGGFTTAGGTEFFFGIQRTVTINGDMVSVTRLVLDNLPNLMQGSMPTAQFVSSLGTVVQNGPGNSAPAAAATIQASALSSAVANTVTNGSGASSAGAAASPAPVAAPAPATTTAPAPATTTAPTPATAAAPVQTVQPATPAPAAATAQPLVVQMTVNGQTIQVPNGAALGLAIQNSVSNTRIDVQNQIDLRLSTLSALQSGQFAAALRQQAIDSVRR
jgi:hypothetical protein